MRRPSRYKRTNATKPNDTFSLMVHGPEYGSGEEVVINPDCFPEIKVSADLSQMRQDGMRLSYDTIAIRSIGD